MASTSIQTVPSSFTSAFSKPQPVYDVFLSFRGDDTCFRFTDHLYHALVDKEIITFRDDKELKMGEPISLELLEAIEKSRIAIIIFSENYASSTWCLEELAKIFECRDRGILRVLPIFYHVEPADVRDQKNTFAEAFAKHEKRFEENPKKVQKWRAALTNVANLSGERLKDGVHEANFIRSIVQWIYSKLREKLSNNIEDDLVGISSRVEEMISYLDLESTDVHFIGICEKSGMGKTTLARAVFDKIVNKFEACSFLENVSEESKAHGLKTLQERLLCDIGKGGLRVKDEHKGMQVISDMLHNKKVLIVVDDVSERSQLEKLVGKRDLFGKGSRIIVTTEDKDLLASYEIKIVYKARGLNEVEALQLFSLNAFHKPHCENDFLEYCNNFVKYAQKIPLVLKVLGSYLCTRTKNEWESAQNQLRALPHEKTTKKLRIAFDGLGAEEKELFLDIACFFKGEEKNRIADILESVYFLDINLKNLIDKSLITLVRGEKLWMHSLLQQMGWEIVSEESKEARERSRLWHCDDVLDVLKNNTGTKHIEGMLLRLPPDEEEEELNAESFSKMNKLRLLKICKVRLSCLSYLSNELCLLEWHDYPLESLPNSFQPGELVELIMHRSCLQQLPSEFSKLGKLKLIDLSDSQNLTRTPDFTGFSNIERLNFQGCTRLHELHPSVGGLKRLILLNLKDCKCLKNLPYELNLESLKTLILSGCSRFKKFPRIGRNMRSLLELYLDGTAIEELPPTIRRCKCQPPKVGHLLGLSPIGSSIGATLTFPRLISFLFQSFLAWRYTYLRIPIFATTALSTYCFHNARHPEPEPINLLLSNSFSKLSTLVTLSLSDCNLLALPDDPSCLSSIEYLNLSKNNFICLPDCISQLSKLKILFLDHCSKLKSLPYVPLSTRLVSVQGCTALENYSSQVVVWTLGVAGFTIITCLGLAEDEDGTIAEVSLLDIHLLWQRYVKDQIHQMEGFCHVLPQIEIPEWFKHQRFGSFRPIPLPSNLFSNKNWKGIALCVIFVVPAHSNYVSPGEDTKYFHEFYCLLEKNGDPIAFKVPKETCVGSFGVWLYISHARFRKHLDERSCITPFIGTNSPDIEINMCGERILYKQDMGEFLQNLGQKIFGSPNDLRGELKSHSQLSRLYQSFFLDKSSGKKCYLLAARELSIEWGFTPKYWRWISLPEESRFPEVAELNRVYWFDIRGKMSTSILSPKTRYAAYLVYKLRSGAHGFDGPPFKASVGTVGGEVYEQTVRLDLFVMEPNQQDQIIPLPQQHTSRPKQREDGWLEIELGQFFNGEGEDDELQIKLREIEALNEKTGLVVEGIEIRPTKGAGQDQ
uniref:ADP-ribosyl cyclase/cyclic ADP-ribose hydrolase n=1 Tax=Quercus lobata TaxID=97700 RepID=A0A7N2LEV3_QUELO